MSYSNNEQLYRQIIMDHYQHPRNKGLSKEEGYVNILKNNPTCGDTLTIQIKFENEKVIDVRQEGEGCSICCASSSMMSELLKGKTIEEVERIIESFENMLFMKEFDEELIEEAISLQGVAKLPPRIKCATLAWGATRDVIKKYQKEGHYE
ncbi:MAG: Fe-S cluster assembly sulfur transfer protein SufU [Culicoidibacterales bacterium]